MKGYLYIIRNDINNRVYIGKTYISLSIRWKRHVNDALRMDREHKYKFQNAILKYGPEHFKIELIGEFEEGILEQKEIEYIAKYDSYHNGYNSTLGGDGNRTRDIDNETVIELYKSGYSIRKIQLELGLGSTRPLSKILRDAGLSIDRQCVVKVNQYDLDSNLLNTFESKMDAWKWLVENYKGDIKRNTAYYYIKKASESGGVAFGYKWKQSETDSIHSQKYVTQFTHLCNAYDTNGNIVLEGKRVIDVANDLINSASIVTKDVRTVYTTIIDHDKNHIYGLYWEIYTVPRYE